MTLVRVVIFALLGSLVAAHRPQPPRAAWPAVVGLVFDDHSQWRLRNLPVRITAFVPDSVLGFRTCGATLFEPTTDSIGYFVVPAESIHADSAVLCMNFGERHGWRQQLVIPAPPLARADTLWLRCDTHSMETHCKFGHRSSIGR